MPTAEAVQSALGYTWTHKVILIGGFFGIITTINACVICATRIMLFAARKNVLPEWFGVIDPKTQTLKNAVLFVGIFIIIGPFLALSWTSSNMGPVSFVCAAIVTCFAALKMRKTHPDMPRPYKIKNSLTIYIAIAVSLLMFISFFVPGSYEYIKWPNGYIYLASWAVIGFLFYKWQAKRNI